MRGLAFQPRPETANVNNLPRSGQSPTKQLSLPITSQTNTNMRLAACSTKSRRRYHALCAPHKGNSAAAREHRMHNSVPKSPKLGISLKLGLWNVRGCSSGNKLSEVERQLRERNFSIVVLTETKLYTSSTVLDGGCMLYNSGKEEGEKREGGVGIMVVDKDIVNVRHCEYVSERIVSTFALIDGHKVGIVGCYAPTECSLDDLAKDKFYELLNTHVLELEKSMDEIIILGDFNCRVNKNLRTDFPNIVGPHANGVETTANGYRLVEFCDEHSMRIENSFYDKPAHRKNTWYHPRTNQGAMLDMVIMQRSSRLRSTDIRASRGADANSDHVLVTAVVKVLPGKKNTSRWTKKDSRKVMEKWQTKDFAHNITRNMAEFKELVNEEVKEAQKMDDIYGALETAARKAVNKWPTIRKPWKLEISDEIKLAIKCKHQLRRKWLSDKSEDSLAQYRMQRRKVRSMVRKQRENQLDELMSEFSSLYANNDQRLAYEKFAEALKLANGRFPQVKRHTNVITNQKLCEHYQTLFEAVPISINEIASGGNTHNEPDLTMEELESGLKRMTNGKAPGMNGIRSELVKYGGHLLHEKVLEEMNRYWRGEERIPGRWVEAEVLSIYKKKGDKLDPNNYRSIFLLDVVGKLYSAMVCERLLAYSEPQMANTQTGFRRNLSTSQAILAARHLIQSARDQHSPLVLAFVDLKKAFDSVSHRAIMNALKHMKCSQNILYSIQQMLDSPVGFLRDGEESFVMRRGVRQGSKEGPTLFNIVFDYIMNEAMDGIDAKLELKADDGSIWYVQHVEYADDLCLIGRSRKEIKMLLESLQQVLQKHGMSISYAKTKYMMTEPEKDDDEELTVAGQVIEKVRHFNYLGSVICDDGDNMPAVRQNVRKAKASLIKLRPALRSEKLAMRTKLRMVETFIKPVLLYGLETVVLTATMNDKLEALLNTSRRMILGLTNKKEMPVSELREKLPLKHPATQIQKKRLNLWFTMSKRPNNLTHRILRSVDARARDKRRAHTKSWMRQLERDAEFFYKEESEHWLKEPFEAKTMEVTEYRPKLVGERTRDITCSAEGCERKFATRGEMYRHLRTDHTMNKEAATETTDILRCPVENCSKQYKTNGWLKSHMTKCHPNYDLTCLTMDKKQEGGTEQNTGDHKGKKHKCPYEGCKKELPTWKGIVNHCYRVHAYSAIAKKPTVPGKRQKTTMSGP